MKTKEKNALALTEITRRVNKIRDNWGTHERLLRRLAGKARCEVLETLLALTDQQTPKAA